MKKIALREAKRNNDSYRPYAFDTLGKYSEARTDIDMFEEVHGIVVPILVELCSDDKMDTSDDTPSGGNSHESETITTSISALFRGVNVTRLDPSPLTYLPTLLGVIQKILLSPKITVAARTALYDRTKSLFDGLRKRTHSQGSSRYELALDFFRLLEVPSGSGTEIMRTKRGEAAEAIALALIGGVFGMFREGRAEAKTTMKGMVADGRKDERSPGVRTVWDRVMKALDE
jgi:proteasome component ECM29